MAREDLFSLFVSLALRPHARCLYRTQKLSQPRIRYASTSNIPPPPAPKSNIPLHVGLDRNPDSVSAISRIPIPKGERGEKFTPSVLSRPLGLQNRPLPGQNSPLDRRTLRERTQEFTSYEKALERRRVYLRSFFRPYFQEWRRVDHWKGKSFVSNERLFKREKALYFPNIWGQTLSKDGDGPDGGRDLAPAITGKISIIGMQSGQWAEEQVDTFVSPTHNPTLPRIIEDNNGLVQRIDVNIQGDWIRALLVKIFSGRLRKMIPEDRWDKYFMIKLPRDIRRGLTDDVRDAMGFLNSQVGYVYLVDSSCKIRWAGSGHAWEGEVEGLNAAVQRLIQEEQKLQASSISAASALTSKSLSTSKPRSKPQKLSGSNSDAITAAAAA
ncbi:Mitochondrial ATPase complex subunit atp10 [Elasticomyces elasticus]|uniref:Mitochondrial ATPase complex subunit atp10 n=1 Tax=Exophiala sideris TaxID=1016849 RepID=A0ABR0J5T0_9EURO|nr:Mitochondrial ATPase complex subunit atp10 [Elasticomyces elasticus]KAK5028248.1 Mitochondrial ATPase complex subunit atp10 [Exophiala sideris]KAK5036109.1 Mitochondrial ATPase complex subunit atp10 [Exophiala sideris]KAK5057146.1 Mitochondrial ATPase complex subunit atp10 [Exophiala sideris]KAK5181553.1 Mitochondrial ATPase complex subunit atp10 [Eurotiomycetes sp. CCFEE 6388]